MRHALTAFLPLLLAVLLVSGARGQVPTTGLLLHYPFSGNTLDASSSANHGVISTASPTTDRFGQPNSAYRFTKGQFIESLKPIGISGNSARTFSCWVRLESAPAWPDGTIIWGYTDGQPASAMTFGFHP